MVSAQAPQVALDRSIECFRRERVRYALIGGWALALLGRPRATLDLDFLVLAGKEDLDRLADRFIGSGMRRDEDWEKFNPMLYGHQVRLRWRGVAVDLLRPRDAHDEQAIVRRRRRRIGGRSCWVVAPDDFILQKLKLGRPRDFEDALTVLARSGKLLDRAYLRRWAKRLGLSGELDYLLSA